MGLTLIMAPIGAKPTFCYNPANITSKNREVKTMAKVMIKCPQTKKEVFTGMAMDKESFRTTVLSGNAIQCPHCKQTHVWNKENAYLKDG